MFSRRPKLELPFVATDQHAIELLGRFIHGLWIDLRPVVTLVPELMFCDAGTVPFHPMDGQITLCLTDQDMRIDSKSVSEFSLCLYNVQDCTMRVEATDGANVSHFGLDAPQGHISLTCYKSRFTFKVASLLVRLEQVP